jgi:hypothetical protein
VFAGKIIITKKTAFKLLFGGAFSVFARGTATVQTHWALRASKPF